MRHSKPLLAAMLVGACAAAAPGSAAGWDRPLTLGEQTGFGPFVAVDRHGVTRVLRGVRRNGFEVAKLRRGSRHASHCRVPGRRAPTSDPGFRWAAGPSGANVLAFNERTGVKATSARPGGCFRRPRVVSRGRAQVGSVAIGAGGSAVAAFAEAHGTKPSRTVYASGPAGGTLRRRGAVVPARYAEMFPDVMPAFVRGDRLVWTMRVYRRSGERNVHQLFASLGGAARVGRFRAVSAPVPDETSPELPFVSDVFTNARGGQVAALFGEGYVSVLARRPGRSFGAPRTFPTGSSEFENEGATNARGDTVLAWESEDDIFALVRRRSGRLVGPQLLTPGDSPARAEQPAVAIDARGRAVVAWLAQDPPAEQSAPAEVRVAVAGPGGRFGIGGRIISGPRRAGFSIPMDVAVNARGEAAVTFMRERVDPSVGVVSAKTVVVRGHTSG